MMSKFAIGGGPVSSLYANSKLQPSREYSDSESDSGDEERELPDFDVETSTSHAPNSPAPPSQDNSGPAMTFEEARAQLKTNCKLIKNMFTGKLNNLQQLLSDSQLQSRVVAAWGQGEEHMFDIVNYVNQVMLLAANPNTNNKKLMESIRTLRKKSASAAFLASLENEIQEKRAELKDLQKQKAKLDEDNKKIILKKDYAAQKQKKAQQLQALEQSLAKDFDTTKLKQTTEANQQELKAAEQSFKAQEEAMHVQLAKLPSLATLKKEMADAQAELKKLQKETLDWERKTLEMNLKTAKYVVTTLEDEEDEQIADECVVCLDELTNRAVFSPCGHDICVNCFMRAASTPGQFGFMTCPSCRRPVERVKGNKFDCVVMKEGNVVFKKGKLVAVE